MSRSVLENISTVIDRQIFWVDQFLDPFQWVKEERRVSLDYSLDIHYSGKLVEICLKLENV